MLGVVDHLAARLAHEPDRIADHLHVFFERDRQDRLHLVLAALADDRHAGRLRIEQGFHAGIVLRLDPAAACHPKRADLGAAQLELANVFKERGVLGIGEGEAAFDVIDAELVEPLRDQQLVLQ